MFQVRLKELRENAKLSQAALAKKVGVGQSTVGMWESGRNKPENSKLESLATLFNVSTDYLLGRPENFVPEVDTELTELIAKFKALDTHGKYVVSLLINAEFSRCQASADDALYDKYMRKSAEDRAAIDAAEDTTSASAR